ncbi:SRPBCC family protein [Streptomyces sp. MUM 203J]|uniref:SRPBCC domain-containing protein n=1 Tax=Streptomyces sp. MUM 203J TaxID=2791990 RepID=UPI001F045DA7|nr:SRPBCC domain-containing protein [Streptomyces sp. MUM 203J]MCH0539833.1 SRPBCC family protein [Streptomyces sp. MUM 203J]
MEHEVFVPVPVQTLRDLLADPARVAPCVPGLQQDAEASAEPLSGRLKVRVGGHTITYRGALRVEARGDGAYAVEGEGTEARGTGGAKLALTVRLEPAEGGTTLAFSGAVTADGRLADIPDDAAAAAAHRLLDRFSESLAEEATAAPRPEPEEQPDEVDEGAVTRTEAEDAVGEPAAGEIGTPAPPGSPDPFAVDGFPPDDTLSAEPPAEAAHARRTMIGRSAEEVDHAPPRGRYAPVPGPAAAGSANPLRWLAPAALAIASAVVVGRALRRRR